MSYAYTLIHLVIVRVDNRRGYQEPLMYTSIKQTIFYYERG